MTLRVAVARGTSILADGANSHNRLHPDLPPVAEMDPGEEVVLELRDGMDGGLGPGVTAEGLRTLELDSNHPMTGPIRVRGAEPGDVLEIETLEIEPASCGATAVIPGFGLLGDRFDEPFLVRWEIAGGLALPPQAKGAVPATEPFASRGLRTIPPREHGGNLDIPQLTEGSRLRLAVHVEGALLSVGDAHFAQGEGESCGTAIEVEAVVRLRVSLCKAADAAWVPRFAAYEFRTPAGPPGGRACIATTGIPLDDAGANGSLDVRLAARRAMEELVDLLCATRGLTPAQACVLVSVAADLRISEAVNVPNALVSAILPLDVFES